MDIEKLFDENEKPLDNLVEDGGFCGIFRTIVCIGDSLSSGEFISTNENGDMGYHDFYDYSWGQHIARRTGAKVYNASRGGMTARRYLSSYGRETGSWWDERIDDNKVDAAKIIALGVNDINEAYGKKESLGDISDIDLKDCKNNKDTFAGNYAKIIQRLREEQPKCRIFLMTIPRGDQCEEWKKLADRHAELLHEIAGLFEFVYVIDLRKYAPEYDENFKKKFYLGNHMNPMGYLLTAKMVMSYIDWIIRHNMDDFKQIAFIGKPYHHLGEKW